MNSIQQEAVEECSLKKISILFYLRFWWKKNHRLYTKQDCPPHSPG